MRHRDQAPWLRSLDFAEIVFRITLFPEAGPFPAGAALRRTAVEISARIAQALGPEPAPRRDRHLARARAAWLRAEVRLRLAHRLGYLEPNQLRALLARLDALAQDLTAPVSAHAHAHAPPAHPRAPGSPAPGA